MTRLRTIMYALATAAFLLLALPAGGIAAGEKIAVLISSKDAPYNEALTGLKGYLQKQAIEADYDVSVLEGNAAADSQTIQKVKTGGAKLVVTLGSLATDMAIRELSSMPVVACMVMKTDGLKKSPNVTGVGLEFPLEVQFRWMRTLLPSAKIVGVLYNPEENQKRVEAAGRIMQSMGLKLIAQEVRSSEDVLAAVERLAKKVDVIWGMADNLALSPQFAKNILLLSFQNNVPFVGLSPMWVRAGALYSLDWDYADIGAQAGDMALKVLKGTPPSAIPTAAPRKVLYALNLKIAQQMNITFSDKIVRGARLTF